MPSINMGVLLAADTFLTRAYGLQEYKEVGGATIRSAIVACSMLLIPAKLLSSPTAMNWVFDNFGQDPGVAALAGSWLTINVAGVPFVLLFRI